MRSRVLSLKVRVGRDADRGRDREYFCVQSKMQSLIQNEIQMLNDSLA